MHSQNVPLGVLEKKKILKRASGCCVHVFLVLPAPQQSERDREDAYALWVDAIQCPQVLSVYWSTLSVVRISSKTYHLSFCQGHSKTLLRLRQELQINPMIIQMRFAYVIDSINYDNRINYISVSHYESSPQPSGKDPHGKSFRFYEMSHCLKKHIISRRYTLIFQ